MAKEMSNGSSTDSKNHHAKIPKIKFTKLFINGEFVDAVSGKTFETIDPRNGEVTAKIAEGDREDVDLAVKAAREAFDYGKWPRMSGSERGKIMMKYADLIEENAEELAGLDTINAGKLYSYGKVADIPTTANTFRYYAGAADKIHGETLKMARELQGYTLREPIGVVGQSTPWNFPSVMFAMKVAPALAAGCTMVVKPAEQTPLSALFYAHLSKLAGIPDGVLNVITGFGPTAGAAISSHMDIDKVSFTGSTEVGRLVMQASATSNLKPVSLELGGKSPLVIFNDADLDMAVNIAFLGILSNKGEICVAGSRVYVQDGIYDEFVKKAAEKAKTWVVGDPFDPLSQQGPQADKQQFKKILSYIEHGKGEGATLLTGGKPCMEKGYYIEPTIFTDVKEDMKIVRDEIFGPVMSLMKFKTMEEAIQRANNTRYGLAAGIVTRDLNIANTVSRSIRAGIIWINCYLAFDKDCPFGGYKMSGFGRDNGLHSLEKYLQIKSVVTPIYNSPWL
ncbi:aldehyde dehydrogenase family 2 member C4 [Macadamia integrifolia]|uniref:aldehyde dehydrogenase family 2 member C4 n=1 Tax=Macadamia integrifolia TaxID=60698 RepID=UPI001C4FCB03|nr:aldehyde dehydrogenase family 2 member C4 [Macadamia integrifolia]XP_042481947.1 aldehyde dehydrogenase family 2 member C4 [Macadamia integrifolia]